MRKVPGAILIILFSATVLASLWLFALAWNTGNNQHGDPLLFIPLLILLLSVALLFRKAFITSVADPEQNNAQTVKDETERPLIKKEKIGSRSDNLNIDGIARKIARDFDPEQATDTNGKMILKVLSSEIEIMTGIYYTKEEDGSFAPSATYAVSSAKMPEKFLSGEGLNGQAVQNRQPMLIHDLPPGYLTVSSGLGEGVPSFLALIPVQKDEEVTALIECAGFRKSSRELEQLLGLISAALTEKHNRKKERRDNE